MKYTCGNDKVKDSLFKLYATKKALYEEDFTRKSKVVLITSYLESK